MSTATLHNEKKKTLVPQLRFSGFEGEWKNLKFPEMIVKSNQGVNTTTEKVEYSNSGYTVVRSNNISENDISFEEVKYVDEETFKKIKSSCKPKKGDILYCNIGSALGSAALYLLDDDIIINWNVFRIQPDFSIVDNFFMTQELNRIRKTMRRFATESTMPFISSKAFNFIKFNIPTLPEQQKIASFLSAVDDKIKQLTRKATLLEHYKKGVMQQLFSGKLRFKDENGKDFADWEEKKLGEVAKITMGQSPESKSYNTDSNGMLLIQGNADIKDRLTLPRQWTSEPTKTCEIGDLILTVRAPVGSIAKSLHNACIGRGVCSIINNKNSIKEYLYQFFLSYESKWTSLEQGSTFTAVSGNDIKGLKLYLPSIKEQQKIANFLSGIDTKIEKVNQQLAQTQTFKKGLLQQMFV